MTNIKSQNKEHFNLTFNQVFISSHIPTQGPICMPVFEYFYIKLQYLTFWATRPNSHRNMSYRSVILIESKSKKRHICFMCAISMLPVLKFSFLLLLTVLYTSFKQNTMFLVIENIFHSNLNGTMILYVA